MTLEKIPIVLHANAATYLGADYLRVRGCSRDLCRVLAPAACPKLWAALRPPLAQLAQLLTRPSLNTAALSAFNYQELPETAHHQALRRAEPCIAAWLTARWPKCTVYPWLDFQFICAQGYVAAVDWVMAHYAKHGMGGITAGDIQSIVYRPLWAACRHGRLDVARRIASHFGLAKEHIMAGSCEAMRSACESDDLAVAKWIATRFDLQKKDIQLQANHILLMACAGGKLYVVQWLVRYFRLKVADARCRDNWALQVACANGYLPVVQWLVDAFGLTAADVRSNGNYALIAACSGGHIAVMQWLTARFGLGPSIHRRLVEDARLRLDCDTVCSGIAPGATPSAGLHARLQAGVEMVRWLESVTARFDGL